ncbi:MULTISPECIES: response regulator transcription factor [unclassified Sphingomonas]|uniref:response regulator transcription factor n=1 Tax=unclassified Sphingomonas TaxID=196159 RepID=UPI00226ADEBD|nr:MULTISPECIES: response regulator transcription factor [unclassified Sphingomonas]
MTKRVLVVEDDFKLAEYLRNGLTVASYEVEVAMSAAAAICLFDPMSHSVVLLDRMLPDVDGLHLMAQLRTRDDAMPIIILSAISSVDERVRGLSHGADDYIVKPFHISEVIARIEAVGRRSETRRGPTTRRYADLELDVVERTVARAGRDVQLNNREFNILRYMVGRPGELVARRTLLKEVWDYDFDPGTNLVDVHISRIRAKISQEGSKPLIHPVRGIGYVLELRNY